MIASEIAHALFHAPSLREAGTIDSLVPHRPGFYCILLKDTSQLPEPFYAELQRRETQIIYVGLASKSLKTRFLGNELRGKSHGTFFRSLGAVLGYRPLPGSLKNKVNKRNFKFSRESEQQIVAWINDNLLVNWVICHSELDALETHLIQQYTPLLNLAKNPQRLATLTALRQECVRVANS